MRAKHSPSSASKGATTNWRPPCPTAAEPKLLLLDEPVSGMNPAEKASFMATIGRIRARGVTIVLVEHDMRTVMGASDRVICLNQGHIIANGTPQEIQRNPDVIRAYLGERSTRARA
jgi:branched-chain amino acid transport system ATP-binding protein